MQKQMDDFLADNFAVGVVLLVLGVLVARRGVLSRRRRAAALALAHLAQHGRDGGPPSLLECLVSEHDRRPPEAITSFACLPTSEPAAGDGRHSQKAVGGRGVGGVWGVSSAGVWLLGGVAPLGVVHSVRWPL